MTFKVYGTGSSGNTYTLTSSTGKTLVLDAGINPKNIFRDITPSSIEGVLVTHEHKDHSLYVAKYAEYFIATYTPYKDNESNKDLSLDEYRVKVLNMSHDVPCVGFLIRHRELNGDILYATDTNGINWCFDRLALAIIEADYEIELLKKNVEKGITPMSVAKRTIKTHNSLSQAVSFLKDNVKKVEKAVLVHLSRDNARNELFEKFAQKETRIDVVAAHEGMVINLEKYELFN